jgi:hypothetical protein
MRTSLLAILFVTLLFTPSGFVHQIDTSSVRSLAQEPEESTYLPRIYGEDLSLTIFSSTSYSGYRDHVEEFTSNGSRWILDYNDAHRGNNMEARLYLLNKMRNLSNGRMETEVVGDHLNVIGKLPGYLPGNNPAIAIVGHYDSWYVSIGANEGGSGIATILELIEPLSSYEWPLDIYFIALNGRYAQWGPFGSGQVSTYFFENQIELLQMYCVEALLVENPYALPDERVFMTYLNLGDSNYHVSHYWADLGRVMSKNYGQNYIKPQPNSDLPIFTSSWYDHNVFIDRGYMNLVVPFESGFDYDDSYRTIFDNWANLDYRYQLGAEVTGAIGASIAYTMAREYGKPVHHEFFINIEVGRSETYYIPISTPTTINVTSRWFGGTLSYTLTDPNLNVIAAEDYNRTSAWTSTEVFSEPVSQKGIYRLQIENTDHYPVGIELEYSHDSDIDGNGILDSEEYWLDTILFEQDSDLDSISDAHEIIYGTDMNNPDSDSDSMPDNYEIEQGFDPRDPSDGPADADGDSLSNAEEYALGLNPWRDDSDYDKIPDAWEIEHGLNPLMNDALNDPDEDGKSNLDEYKDDTDPFVAETNKAVLPWFVVPSIVGVAFVTIVGLVIYRESKIID